MNHGTIAAAPIQLRQEYLRHKSQYQKRLRKLVEQRFSEVRSAYWASAESDVSIAKGSKVMQSKEPLNATKELDFADLNDLEMVSRIKVHGVLETDDS